MGNREIWDALVFEIGNPYGVAGLMGNIMAESSMRPNCITTKNKSLKSDEYIAKIKSGEITPDEFAHDGVAFGLVQWRYWSRKEALLKYTGAMWIDDLAAQINFLLQEIKTYKTVSDTLQNATSVREASDIVMERYEKPANMSEAARAKREAFGLDFLHEFNKTPTRRVITTVDKVNLRCGNGKRYSAVGRAEKAGTTYEWIATSEDGWYAVETPTCVAWISGDFAKVVTS